MFFFFISFHPLFTSQRPAAGFAAPHPDSELKAFMLRMCLFMQVTRKSAEMSSELHLQIASHLIVFTDSEQHSARGCSCMFMQLPQQQQQ